MDQLESARYGESERTRFPTEQLEVERDEIHCLALELLMWKSNGVSSASEKEGLGDAQRRLPYNLPGPETRVDVLSKE